MKILFPALCWAVLIGGFACAKHPAPAAPVPPVSTPAEDLPMPDPNETVLALEAPEFTLFFEYNSSALREAYKAAALAKYLKATGFGLHLMGHTSEEGTPDFNLALGARRAQAVRDYLEASGVPAYTITWESFGEEKPANTDPDHKDLNRRVEARIEGVSK